jgi:alcohol dehydrogenase class IV
MSTSATTPLRTIAVQTASRSYDVLVGADILGGLGSRVRTATGASRPFVVTDTTVGPLYLTRVEEALHAEGYDAPSFAMPAGEVNKHLGTLGDVCQAIAQAELSRDDTVVALGGGSPMDCAKGICAKAAWPNRSVTQLVGLLRVHKRVPKLFAIPTTSGTGSETTIAAVIIDAQTHRKAVMMDMFIIPAYAILDPELTVTLPPDLTATTGMDALCHAIEAYTNHRYNTKFEDILAKRAVRLIYDNLYAAYKDGADIEARENMQIAAFYAGRAFTRGCVGYVHAIGHTLGGLYGFPHGKAMAILLPHVMRAYGPAVHKRLAELANVCGITGKNDAEKAEKFIGWIEEMKEKTGIPEKLDIIKNEDMEQIIAWAMKEANPLYPTPVLWRYEDFRAFIESVRV